MKLPEGYKLEKGGAYSRDDQRWLLWGPGGQNLGTHDTKGECYRVAVAHSKEKHDG